MKNLFFYCCSVHEVMGRASREASPSKARLLGTWRAKSLTKTTSHENLEKLGKFCTKHGNLETKISHKTASHEKPDKLGKKCTKLAIMFNVVGRGEGGGVLLGTCRPKYLTKTLVSKMFSN